MARRLGVVDVPGGRRVNQLPVPRLGGRALFFGVLVPPLASCTSASKPAGRCRVAVAVTVGIIDDFRGLPWFAELGGRSPPLPS